MKTKIVRSMQTLPALILTMALMAGLALAQTESASTKTADSKGNSSSDTAASTGTKKRTKTKKADAKKTDPKKTEATEPTSQTVGEDAGDYTVVSTIEFGYRGQRVDGDVNKFKSDLNYKAGPRLFDTSFFMRSKEGKTGLFDSALVTSTGWGADPYGNVRLSVENAKWFRFDGTYRRFKYYNFLNNLANPNTAGPTAGPVVTVVPPNPITGKHGYDTRQQMGDFDLTLLPKNDRLNFTFGFSPERYQGTVYTTYHAGGGEFFLPTIADSRANEFRVGANWKLGPVDFGILQGYRRFTDDSNINGSGAAANYLATSTTNLPVVNTFIRQQPVKGTTDYTRFNLHTFLAKKVDITGRFVYSDSNTNFNFLESLTGQNWTIVRGSTVYTLPNVITQSALNYTGSAKRPSTIADLGVSFFATSKLTFSDTFRFEQYQVGSGDFYTSAFYATKTNGTAFPPAIVNGNYGDYGLFKYRKFLNSIEGDYQISRNFGFHFGYRYGTRREEDISGGYTLGGATTPAAPTAITSGGVEENHTNIFFGGLKARPLKNWTIYFDAEHGTADNIFTRWGNYNYTNFRAKSRYTPNRKWSFNAAVITRDNSDPSTIEGVSLADFGVSVKSRVFTSDISYMPNSRLAVNGGYNYNWLTSDTIINYAYAVPPFPSGTAGSAQASISGHSLYYVRNNFFYLELTARLNRRMTLYAGYHINDDNGQGNLLSNPRVLSGTALVPGAATVITSYPMSFQSPEGRLAIRLNRRLDWNLGYQYFNYNESQFANTFAGTVRPQNYHAHLPYMSLRLYFGRKE